MIAKTVYVTADLQSNIINAEAVLGDNVVSANADLVNKVTYKDAEKYEGSYEVVSILADPSMTSSLVLHTKGKMMSGDLTIYSVPTSEEYNEQGGVTFTIGL